MNEYEQARRIELHTRRLVNNQLLGHYRSAFRGSGLELAEQRPYSPGDDVRHINWPITARAQRPFINQFIEERQLTVQLIVDVSGSMMQTGEPAKRARLLEITAVLATAAALNHDQTGLTLITDRLETRLPPGQGRHHTRRLIHTLLTCQPGGRGTDLARGLQTAVSPLKQPALVILLSDLLSPVETWITALRQVAHRHDTLVIQLRAPFDQQLPPLGLLALQDAETGETVWVDSHSAAGQQQITAHTAAQQAAVVTALHHSAVDHLPLSTSAPYLPDLLTFLKRRARRHR